MSTTSKETILDKLSKGVVLGDGGFCYGLEKRGYVKAGSWTPECVLEHPDAVKQYHREFLRSGSDVLQAFTFFASDSQLGNVENRSGKILQEKGSSINQTACKIAKEVANEANALVSMSLTQIPEYKEGKGKTCVQSQNRKQLEYTKHCDVDFIICEFFNTVEEIEWAIEVAKETKKAVAATMCIGPNGDSTGVSTGECAVRMAKAGADIVGVNCNHDPETCLKSMTLMKSALDSAGLKPYLMIQPLGYHTPDVPYDKAHNTLPECPFALEPRALTRFEAAIWARQCYDAGINYIGGCCGFEPYHIRAISEELCKERGNTCETTKENGFLVDGYKDYTNFYTKRNKSDYWKNITPGTGRPHSSAYSETD